MMETGLQITLTAEQEAHVQRAIKSGRVDRPEDAVTDALLLWEEREALRTELLASLDDVRASIARGEGRIITQGSMQALADDAKQRLRTRLTAEQSTPGWMPLRLAAQAERDLGDIAYDLARETGAW